MFHTLLLLAMFMLSLSIIGKKGLAVSGLVYLRVGLICVPLTLFAAVFGLWLAI